MPRCPRKPLSGLGPGRFGTIAATMLGLTAGLLGGVAHADIPGADGVYTGCYTQSTGALRVIDFEAGQRCRVNERTVTWSQTGPQGPPGPQGEQGEQGEPGLPATKLFAFVEGDGTLVPERSSGATSVATGSEGFFTVVFDRDVSDCVYLATTEPRGTQFGIARGYANVFQDDDNPNAVGVLTTNSGGQNLDFSFHLAVFCNEGLSRT